MTADKSFFLLSLAIMCSSAIISLPGFRTYFDDRNVIPIEGGNVRLGKIYSEMLMTSTELGIAKTGEKMLTSESSTKDIVKSWQEEFRKALAAVNSDNKRKEDYLSTEDTQAKVDLILKVKTYIKYRSEYQPEFVLVVDEFEKKIPAGAGIFEPSITPLKENSEKMITKFYSHMSRLR